MQYILTRSKRKTIAISFDGDGNLCVKAPFWVSKRAIETFLDEKKEWIEATAVRLQNQRMKETAERIRLDNGDVLFYLGEALIITVIRENRQRGKVVKVNNRLILTVPYEADYAYKKTLLEKWFRHEAAEVLQRKASEFAKLLSVSYEDIKIKDQKSRWGSCSSKGNLNFNFRIIMAPEKVCDYVVKHELCHLIHMNHSAAFWTLLEGIHPETAACRKWLKENSKKLYLF